MPGGASSLDRGAAADLFAEVGSRRYVSILVRLADERAGDSPLHSEVAEVIRAHDAFDVDVEDLFGLYRDHRDPVTPLLIQWIVGQVPHDELVGRLDELLVAEDERDQRLAVELIRMADMLRGDELPGFGDGGGELIEEDLPEAEPPGDEGEPVAANGGGGHDEPVEANGGGRHDEPVEANGGGEPVEANGGDEGPRERGLEEAPPEDEPVERNGGSDGRGPTANGGGRGPLRNGDDDHGPAANGEGGGPGEEVQAHRWLHADLGDPGSASADRRRAFRAGAPNEVAVFIDLPRSGSLAAVGATAADSVDAKLEGDVTHSLTVLFQVPALGVAQAQPIELPPDGPSDTATFAFDAPPAGQRVDAMITVLHANRALQAATLTAHCFEDPDDVPAGFEATFRFAAIRPGTAGVEDRRPFDAAVVARGGAAGPGAAGSTDGDAVAFDDEQLGPVADRIRNVLRRLADDAPSFAGGLRAPATASFLRELAFQGRDLHRLVGEPLEERRPGAPLDRIQVVVTETEAFIPVEFVYDLPTPTVDAGLCPNAEQALAEGRCDPANHPAGPLPGTATVVCPVGFWALRKVIERQVVAAGDEDELRGMDFSIRAEVTAERPALDPITHALAAWSDRVDLAVPGQSEAVLAALNEVTADRAVAVETWEEWVDTIRDQAPPLLVVLSHTVTEQGTAALEIGPDGTGSRCLRVGLVQEFVKKDPAARPMVLLLGCDTAVGRAEPETFIARLRDVGAAVVVGTVAPVLGENAAPVAVGLLRALRDTAEAATGATFGGAMVKVRRDLVAAGHLTALCLTAVGDADWRLSPAGG